MDDTKQKNTADFLMELSDLLRQGKEDDAKRLLTRVEGLLTAKDSSQRSTEHFAAVGGCLSILQYAINMNSSAADSPDELGWTPLIIASSAGRIPIVKYLLSLSEVDINKKTKNGQTALHYAASKYHKEIVYLLLESGADVNAADRHGHTPLHRAASQGHEQVVYLLLKQPKIHLNVRDSEGNTPLFLACEEDREDIAISLVSNGALLETENKEGKKPLDVVKTTALRMKLKKAEERANVMEN